MVSVDLLYMGAHCIFVAGSIYMFYTFGNSFFHEKTKIPKRPKKEIYIENIEDKLPYITLMIPAFMEQKVIGNTVDKIANLHYPKDKYAAIFLVDEKEDIAKKDKGKIVTKLAKQIIKNGNFIYSELYQELKNKYPRYSKKCLVQSAENYLNDAHLLIMSLLREEYHKLNFNNDENFEKKVVSNSFSILNGCADNGEFKGQLEDIVNNSYNEVFNYTLNLINNITPLSEEELDSKLWEIYISHDLNSTTKDIIEKRIKEKYSNGNHPKIDFAIVPNNFGGDYKGNLLNKPVQSSKGRALNYGLSIVDERYPQTDIIGIYDADGRPHQEVLAYIGKESLKIPNDKDFFFQGPIYLVRNYNEVDWVCKQSGLSGTIWHRLLYPTLIFKSNRPGVNSITHFSGTNYFFTKRIVEKVKGWPSFHPTEDLGLAYRVHMEFLRGNIEKPIVKPHPCEEIEQTTQKVSMWFKQQYRWASGGRYQLEEVIKSDLSLKDKFALSFKLLKALLASLLALVAGVSGVALTAATVLGFIDIPHYANGLKQFVQITMGFGFAIYMSIPVGIYLWSLKNNYISYKGFRETLRNMIEIVITNIPYIVLATILVLGAWIKRQKGWGSKTPRTEERSVNKEQLYLEDLAKYPEKNPRVSLYGFNKLYGHYFKKANTKGLTEILLDRRAVVGFKAYELGLKRPHILSKDYSDIVNKYDLHGPVYKFKQNGKKWYPVLGTEVLHMIITQKKI